MSGSTPWAGSSPVDYYEPEIDYSDGLRGLAVKSAFTSASVTQANVAELETEVWIYQQWQSTANDLLFMQGAFCSHLVIAAWQAVLGWPLARTHMPLIASKATPRELYNVLQAHDTIATYSP